ncbi:MAG: BrnT family toxin [Rhizomicrobium sp.]
MEIEFDPDKNAVNRRKHRIDLADAAGFAFETAVVDEDDRRDYGEARFQALGLIGARLHMLVFTFRGANVRVISLRKANKRECAYYEKQKSALE